MKNYRAAGKGRPKAFSGSNLLRALSDDHTRITHDRVEIAGNITRGCVLYQLSRSGAQILRGGQHSDGRTETTHADVVLRDHIVEGAGVEGENWFNRGLVFHARDGVGFVMIHVAGGYDQDAIVLRRNHIRNRLPELFQSFELSGAERDGN